MPSADKSVIADKVYSLIAGQKFCVTVQTQFPAPIQDKLIRIACVMRGMTGDTGDRQTCIGVNYPFANGMGIPQRFDGMA